MRTFHPTDSSESTQAAAELELIAKETGLTFPSGIRRLGVSRDKGIDYILQVKVELPESRLVEFLGSSPIDPNSLKVGGDGSFGPSDAFWDPSHASQLRTAQVMIGSKSLNIGAGAPADGKVTVLISPCSQPDPSWPCASKAKGRCRELSSRAISAFSRHGRIPKWDGH